MYKQGRAREQCSTIRWELYFYRQQTTAINGQLGGKVGGSTAAKQTHHSKSIPVHKQ